MNLDLVEEKKEGVNVAREYFPAEKRLDLDVPRLLERFEEIFDEDVLEEFEEVDPIRDREDWGILEDVVMGIQLAEPVRLNEYEISDGRKYFQDSELLKIDRSYLN